MNSHDPNRAARLLVGLLLGLAVLAVATGPAQALSTTDTRTTDIAVVDCIGASGGNSCIGVDRSEGCIGRRQGNSCTGVHY